MIIITDSRCTAYHRPGHPERPQRILGSVEHLKKQTELKLEWIDPALVADEALLLAHQAQHLRDLSQGFDFDGDTPAYPEIAAHARRSVGAALQAMELGRSGKLAFSLMRPPGHHATRNHAMGFCYLNSIAIACLQAQKKGAKKVAVFDFDVHHGNGTEDIFLKRPDTAYFSVHQFPAYPGTGAAHRENSFNFPVAPDSPATLYRSACRQALEKVKDFKPDLLGISAGFDAFKGDPLCQQRMEANDFYELGREIRALKIPTFSILEGGYSSALPELILAYLKGWSGK